MQQVTRKPRFKLLSAALLCAACGCVSFATAGRAEDSGSKKTFDSGVAAYDAGNYAQAFRIFKSIDDEDLAAMRNVALMLRKGQGVAKDPKAAEEEYLRAAEGGLPTAAADLGEMLMNGEAGPPDPAGAIPWLTVAAAAHHPVAAFELGELYESGRGVTKDIEIARQLYSEAAARDVPGAKERLAALPPPQADAPRPTSPPGGTGSTQ
jgi:TPR repeat protein